MNTVTLKNARLGIPGTVYLLPALLIPVQVLLN